MKALIPIALLTLCVGLNAQQQPTKEQMRARRIAVADQDPFRIFDGKLYDLTEVIYGWKETRTTMYGYPQTAHCTGYYWIQGEVISVGKGFLLLKHEENDETKTVICLKNHPKQNQIVDHQSIACAALPAGRFQYTSGTGGKTVPLFDYGQRLAGSGQTFKVVTRVSADGKNETLVPFDP